MLLRMVTIDILMEYVDLTKPMSDATLVEFIQHFDDIPLDI